MSLSPSRLVAVCGALVLVGSGHQALYHLSPAHEPWRPRARIGAEYGALLPALPASGRVGYLSTEPVADPFRDHGFMHAAYAVAPRVLVRGSAGVDRVVARFRSPEDLRSLCERHGLAPVLVADRVAVLERTRAP